MIMRWSCHTNFESAIKMRNCMQNSTINNFIFILKIMFLNDPCLIQLNCLCYNKCLIWYLSYIKWYIQNYHEIIFNLIFKHPGTGIWIFTCKIHTDSTILKHVWKISTWMNELIMKSSHTNLKPLSQPEKFRTPENSNSWSREVYPWSCGFWGFETYRTCVTYA